ncbi:MAG: hypothetical protein K6E20_02880 [Acholeplasmatales bacterium]|nr:hypothetical protein [Acholeplasmatales bacterium]
MYKECPKCFCNVSEEYDVCPYCNTNLKNAKIKNSDVIKEENNGSVPNENDGLRCIAHKSESFSFFIVIGIFLLVTSVLMFSLGFSSHEGILLFILSIIIIVWSVSYAFVPTSIIFYDEKNKSIIINMRNSEKMTIYLKDIEYVEQEIVRNRYYIACYHNFKIHITGGKTIKVSGISTENEVMKYTHNNKTNI